MRSEIFVPRVCKYGTCLSVTYLQSLKEYWLILSFFGIENDFFITLTYNLIFGQLDVSEILRLNFPCVVFVTI